MSKNMLDIYLTYLNRNTNLILNTFNFKSDSNPNSGVGLRKLKRNRYNKKVSKYLIFSIPIFNLYGY